MSSAALFLCAGRSTRMDSSIGDKILADVAGRPLVLHSLDAFLRSRVVSEIIFLYRDGPQRDRLIESLEETLHQSEVKAVWQEGGRERQDSVMNGLLRIDPTCPYVFIHDCARPLITSESIRILDQAVRRVPAVVLAHRIVDTIRLLENDASTTVPARVAVPDRELPPLVTGGLSHIDRDRLWAMETPQVFERDLITSAYQSAQRAGVSITDDSAALMRRGHMVSLLENTSANPKITTPQDLAYAEFLLTRRRCNRMT